MEIAFTSYPKVGIHDTRATRASLEFPKDAENASYLDMLDEGDSIVLSQIVDGWHIRFDVYHHGYFGFIIYAFKASKENFKVSSSDLSKGCHASSYDAWFEFLETFKLETYNHEEE